MAEHPFDRLTRELAAPHSRRTLVKQLATAAAASVAGVALYRPGRGRADFGCPPGQLPTDTGCAPAPTMPPTPPVFSDQPAGATPPSPPPDFSDLPGGSQAGQVFCGLLGQQCCGAGACEAGLLCQSGICVVAPPPCIPGGSAQQCAVNADCCAGAVCSFGFCVTVCLPSGQPCLPAIACCSGICQLNGFCL